jgi:hypothetical protein
VRAVDEGILISGRRAISPAVVPFGAESNASKKRFRLRVLCSRLSVFGTRFFGVVGAIIEVFVDVVVLVLDFG